MSGKSYEQMTPEQQFAYKAGQASRDVEVDRVNRELHRVDALADERAAALDMAETRLRTVVEAARELCGPGRDGIWVSYSDEHGDAIREHLIPVLAALNTEEPADG